jgi:hypothetical protein
MAIETPRKRGFYFAIRRTAALESSRLVASARNPGISSKGTVKSRLYSCRQPANEETVMSKGMDRKKETKKKPAKTKKEKKEAKKAKK